MSGRQRRTARTDAAMIALAGALLSGAALALSGHAAAEPPAPPPVPAIPNPVYGEGAPTGYFGDLFSSFQSDNPLGELTVPPAPISGAPPGAGPPPPLPPGTISLTAPESSTAPPEGVWLGPLPGMAPVPLAPPGPPPPA